MEATYINGSRTDELCQQGNAFDGLAGVDLPSGAHRGALEDVHKGENNAGDVNDAKGGP